MEASALFEAEDDDNINNEQCSSSATSSIGKDSDDEENENEAHSAYNNKCHQPLDSLQRLLSIRRGISKFYDGKSKSFTSLVDAGGSVKHIAKPENAYTRMSRSISKTKRTTISSSSRSTVALAFAINYDSSSCASEEVSSPSPKWCIQ